MRTLTLTKKSDSSFLIEVTDSNGVTKQVVNSRKSSLAELVKNMDMMGVDSNETNFAVQMLNENGHTKASFGFLGSFISSWNHFSMDVVGSC